VRGEELKTLLKGSYFPAGEESSRASRRRQCANKNPAREKIWRKREGCGGEERNAGENSFGLIKGGFRSEGSGIGKKGAVLGWRGEKRGRQLLAKRKEKALKEEGNPELSRLGIQVHHA